MQRTLSAIATTGLMTAGLALAGPAQAAPAEYPPTSHHKAALSEVVLGGAWTVEFGSPIKGNRHQVRLRTDNGKVSGFIRSFYCPSGATVSPRWASSRCTHRQTIYLKNQGGNKVGWVSSTGNSATQRGYLMGTSGSSSWPFDARFTLYATEPPTDDGDGTFYSWWRAARPQGSFAGKPILAGTTRYGQISGYGPV